MAEPDLTEEMKQFLPGPELAERRTRRSLPQPVLAETGAGRR